MHALTCPHVLHVTASYLLSPIVINRATAFLTHRAPKSSQGFGQNQSLVIKDDTGVNMHEEMSMSRQE